LFCEVLTWTQLGLHAKPCGILNVRGYYTPLLAMFDHAVEERFLKPENRALVLARESPADLLQALEWWRPPRIEKWLSRETR
jgi:predicted Rossmann-fold nucleotide-binding protein